MKASPEPEIPVGFLGRYLYAYSRWNARNLRKARSSEVNRSAARAKAFFKRDARRRARHHEEAV